MEKEYIGKSFFDGFNFVTYDDPTHGYGTLNYINLVEKFPAIMLFAMIAIVNYVDVDTAWSKQLVAVQDNNQVYM
ncbi:hypothetical protein EON63_18405 [archaeon]|nr:MAG: hypothetical protein EON63_18405 [archaeon]